MLKRAGRETVHRQGADFRSLADTWADTTTAHGRLMVTLLSGIAEFERELILARTKEGRARRRQWRQAWPETGPDTSPTARSVEAAGDHGEIARSYNVARSTI